MKRLEAFILTKIVVQWNLKKKHFPFLWIYPPTCFSRNCAWWWKPWINLKTQELNFCVRESCIQLKQGDCKTSKAKSFEKMTARGPDLQNWSRADLFQLMPLGGYLMQTWSSSNNDCYGFPLSCATFMTMSVSIISFGLMLWAILICIYDEHCNISKRS